MIFKKVNFKKTLKVSFLRLLTEIWIFFTAYAAKFAKKPMTQELEESNFLKLVMVLAGSLYWKRQDCLNKT